MASDAQIERMHDMSAPDTNIDTQKRRHRGPLTGLTLALIGVAALFLAWLGWIAMQGQAPREATPEPAPIIAD